VDFSEKHFAAGGFLFGGIVLLLAIMRGKKKTSLSCQVFEQLLCLCMLDTLHFHIKKLLQVMVHRARKCQKKIDPDL